MKFSDILTIVGGAVVTVGLSLAWLPLGVIGAGALILVIAHGLPEKTP